jgi:hypothetical protein
MRVWRNAANGFIVAEVHYSADPGKRGDWKHQESPKYGGLRSWRWRKEQEIDWEAQRGSLVFENWNRDQHFITPFVPPEHWPRWIMFDPGWRNPASMVWMAIDIDAEPNLLGYRPIHLYREFYKAHRSSESCALIAFDWSTVGFDMIGNAEHEWIQEIVIDPAARQEHQSASASGQVNDSADTVLQQFIRKIEELGWDVPIDTGINDKKESVDEIIARLGTYWIGPDGIPLYDASDKFREPEESELAAGGVTLVAPTLFFHACCLEGAREMAKYRWRDWASTEVAERHNVQESPMDKDDHTITNLIRFINLMRGLRDDSGIDLSAFEPRQEPKPLPSPDEILERQHRTRARDFRKQAVRRRRMA